MRPLTPAMQAAAAAETGEIAYFVELAFSGGTVRYTTASAPLDWNAHTWAAVGGHLAFEGITETADLSGGGLALTLSGVDQSIVALLLTQTYIGRSAKVWLAHLDAASGAVVATPALLFAGAMNGGWTVTEERFAGVPGQGRVGTVTVTGRCTDRLAELDQRRGLQTNPGVHQVTYPGDRFFESVGHMAAKPIVWKA